MFSVSVVWLFASVSSYAASMEEWSSQYQIKELTMAIVANEQNTEQTTGNGQAGRPRKEADGWLNLKVVDQTGKEHSIAATIPLYKDNRVHRALMNKGNSPEVVLEILGTVNIVDKDAPEIEL